MRNRALVAPIEGMRRLTRKDWELINDALAQYEAAVGDFYLSESQEDALARQVAEVRLKVFERLPERR